MTIAWLSNIGALGGTVIQVWRVAREGRCGEGTAPQRWGAEDAQFFGAAAAREETSSLKKAPCVRDDSVPVLRTLPETVFLSVVLPVVWVQW
jgi:hypothetical protein